MNDGLTGKDNLLGKADIVVLLFLLLAFPSMPRTCAVDGQAAGKKHQTETATVRSFALPSQSLGALALVPSATIKMGQSSGLPQYLRQASGKFTVAVPPGEFLLLVPSRQIIQEPSLLQKLPVNGIDMLNLEYIAPTDDGTSACDKILGYVSRLKSLRALILQHSDVTDAGCLKIAGMPHLSILDCSFTDVTGSCFKMLASLPELSTLYVAQSSVDETNLAALSSCPRLTTLDLRSSRIHLQGVRSLTGCKELTDLSLRNNPTVNDQCLAALRHSSKLRYLDLSNTRVTVRGLSDFRVPSLAHIRVGPSLKSQVPELEKIFPGKIEIGPPDGGFSTDKTVLRVFAPLK